MEGGVIAQRSLRGWLFAIFVARAFRPCLWFGHFTKTFVSQHVVWIHSFESMMRNCMQRNKIAELVLGAPRETAEMANPQAWASRP